MAAPQTTSVRLENRGTETGRTPRNSRARSSQGLGKAAHRLLASSPGPADSLQVESQSPAPRLASSGWSLQGALGAQELPLAGVDG